MHHLIYLSNFFLDGEYYVLNINDMKCYTFGYNIFFPLMFYTLLLVLMWWFSFCGRVILLRDLVWRLSVIVGRCWPAIHLSSCPIVQLSSCPALVCFRLKCSPGHAQAHGSDINHVVDQQRQPRPTVISTQLLATLGDREKAAIPTATTTDACQKRFVPQNAGHTLFG